MLSRIIRLQSETVCSLLSVFDDVNFDSKIVKREFHIYVSYESCTFKLNEEIRIAIQASDLYRDIANSHIYLESMVKNDLTFIFREARYELNGVQRYWDDNFLKYLTTIKTSEEKIMTFMAGDKKNIRLQPLIERYYLKTRFSV